MQAVYFGIFLKPRRCYSNLRGYMCGRVVVLVSGFLRTEHLRGQRWPFGNGEPRRGTAKLCEKPLLNQRGEFLNF